MLVIASIFRNADWYADRYFEQIDNLRAYMPVRLVIAEGDSTDDTFQTLSRSVADCDTLLKVDHGGPEFDSYDIPERWAQIAYVCNAVLDQLNLEDADRLIYVESDLAWPVDTMLRLHADLDTVGAVAAMSFRATTGLFYDTWGHVGIDGKPFTHHTPYHSSLDGELTEILSAGSCIAVRGDIVNAGVKFSEVDGIRGFCRSIRDHTPLYVDPAAEVFHK